MKFYDLRKLDIPAYWSAFLKEHDLKSAIDINAVLDENENYMTGKQKRIYPMLEFKKFGRIGHRYCLDDVANWFYDLSIDLYNAGKVKELTQ